nr:hypothetical protein [uncultured Dyadobacter sp.]
MPLPEPSPYIRVLPTATTLDVILKNTHFPDDLLSETSPIQCRVEWQGKIPALVFHFKSPAYDFSEPLVPSELKNAERGWLQQPAITIRLLQADTVIADKVAERKFSISPQETNSLRDFLEQ